MVFGIGAKPRSDMNDKILQEYSGSLVAKNENKPIPKHELKRFDVFYRRIDQILNGKVTDSFFKPGLNGKEVEKVLDEALDYALRELADPKADGSLYADILLNCAYHANANIRLFAESRIRILYDNYPGPIVASALATMLYFDQNLAPTEPVQEKKKEKSEKPPKDEKPEKAPQPKKKERPLPELKPLIPNMPGGRSPKYFPFHCSPKYKPSMKILPSGTFIEIVNEGLGVMLGSPSQPSRMKRGDLEYLSKYDKEAWRSCRELINLYVEERRPYQEKAEADIKNKEEYLKTMANLVQKTVCFVDVVPEPQVPQPQDE